MLDSVTRRGSTLITSSGSYNVRASEMVAARAAEAATRINSGAPRGVKNVQNGPRLKTMSATVVFLDDTAHVFTVEKYARGEALLDKVFRYLELAERQYFGLQYCEMDSVALTPEVMRWLDPQKPLKKQIKFGNLYFRVKFYVTDPCKVQEEYTRYQFYLQIRKDIMSSRLQVPSTTACLLASYTVQSELGDFQPDEHGTGYLSHMALVPGQTEEIERKIGELHKLHRGQTPADAEMHFLEHARRLEMYGVDLHKAKDNSGKELLLGVTSNGIVVFSNNVRINTFSWGKIVKISFKRKQFFIQLRREQSESYDTLLQFTLATPRSAKTLWKSSVEHHTFFRLHSAAPAVTPSAANRGRRFALSLLGIGSRFSYAGKTELQAVVQEEAVRRGDYRVRDWVGPGRTPRRAWEVVDGSRNDGGFSDHSPFEEAKPLALDNSSLTRSIIYADEDSPSELDQPTDLPIKNNNNTFSANNVLRHSANTAVIYVRSPEHKAPESDLVVVRLQPDEHGRYGFNVKGGKDIDLPVVVSRVAANTPADRCSPKLAEGDQVMFINDTDISDFTHEQVVNLIREMRDHAPATELVLTVRPNAMYDAGQSVEEPAYQYVPEVATVANELTGDPLSQSMLLLEDGLASGAVLAQFDQLYRKKPGLTMNEARKLENLPKNRYGDISPYDITRVVLNNPSPNDYINANYINMEIPRSGIVNRYVATQGPLSNTVADFWQMVWETGVAMVVMLTPLVERGRIKCWQYWPACGNKEVYGGVEVACVREEVVGRGAFVVRDFLVKDLERNEERDVSQMQYLAWPDHGVPESSDQFLEFTQLVRAGRAGMVEPILVHCSAGIGRTGVLILMETALCLMEANEPVYPLDIVRTMRDQRAMMIQTTSQYRFVCESLLRAHAEGLVKPLAEFSR